jgi:hypothetical protein
MSLYVSVIVRATEVVLLLKLGRNEVCSSTNYIKNETQLFFNKSTFLTPPPFGISYLQLSYNNLLTK